MSQPTFINTPVAITAIGFGRDMQSYPRRMEYGGTTYNFIDAGLRTIIRRGERITQFLTMSDGVRDYQLRHDRGDLWTLLSIQ